jgi:hypothetical protein
MEREKSAHPAAINLISIVGAENPRTESNAVEKIDPGYGLATDSENNEDH